MNKEIANILKEKIQDLPFIDKLAGLVKTIETTDKSEAANPKVIRFPASVDVNGAPLKAWNYADLVPNSTKKSIFYIEGRGLKPGNITARGFEMVSSLRLIGWMNSRFPVDTDSFAIASIISRFDDRPFNSGIFTGIRIKPVAILDSEDKLFSKYTYDEKVNQFLMLPFMAFGIDFEINLTMNPKCIREFNESFDLSFS